jgi:hypothetical protein
MTSAPIRDPTITVATGRGGPTLPELAEAISSRYPVRVTGADRLQITRIR